MFYTSVPPLDHGLLEFPTNSYGGFAYRSNTLETPTTSGESISEDPTKRFVTEHNLALFWRRLGLYPHSLAFPVPLLSTSDDYAIGTRNRPPGNIRADCALIRYRQRNLLAGELVQDDGLIQIWTVNDSSDHKQLLHYKLRFADNRRSCGRKHLLCLERAHTEDSFGRMDLDSEVLQLKAFNSPAEVGGKVFMRTKNSLDLANTIEKSVSRVFRSQTIAFTQIPHLEEELAVVDSRGMLFWGSTDVPNSFTRFKCPMVLKDICSTDCPRVLLSLDEKEVRQLDLRESNCVGQLLFSHSIIQTSHGPFSDQFHSSLTARDRLCHVNSIEVGLETVLVTSARRHTLIDRRMPCVTLLTMPHGEIDGADYSITTPAFDDPETGGPLSHWSLMYHPNECLWSSLGSKYEMDSPRASIVQFVQLHSEMPRIETHFLPEFTRAFHYQQLDKDLAIASTRAILFRQMEGGDIWYENVFFDPLPKLRQAGLGNAEDDYEGSFVMKPIDEAKMKQKALKQIADFQTARTLLGKSIRPHFFEGVQDELMAFNQSKLRQIVDLTSLEIASEFERLGGPNSVQNGASPSPSTSSCCTYPFSTVHHISDECMEMEQIQFNNFDEQFEGHEDKLFSTIVAQTWQKTLERWQEAKEKRVKQELGLLEIGGEQPKSDGDDDGSDGGGDEEEEEEEAGGIR
uniref:Anaphase-promoting complex subunit 1 n=1 Tax=Globodera pallida TaxID=36090 RepID=A0A183BKP7_GLOPA